jgi:2,3-bisphosphoglycerate-independent phosphoglycerate mutase
MKKVILTILDGWGIGDKSKADAIYQANTPKIDEILKKYAHSQLLTSGEDVGLPEGQMGNSEVGHLNIGSGRVVFQDLVRINKAIEDNSISEQAVLNQAFDYAIQNKKKIHLIGLVSDGGVHSSEKHLYKLCDIAKEKGFKDLFVHAITDGRDTDPKSGKAYILELENHLKSSAGKLASIIGRYYAMDRDKRWDRIKLAYDLLLSNKGESTTDFISSIDYSYQNNITDEFLMPMYNPELNSKIEANDVVICFNFRTDRLRQLTTVLTQQDFPEFDMQTLDLQYYTMTNYDDSFKGVNVIYDKENLKQTLGEIISNQGKKQLRIAETEKYAHVTFFFSGGREKEFENEERIVIPSPKVATYDLQPEMSALLVRDKLVEAINSDVFDLIVVNFANGDMVGHTGIYSAILKAIETIDTCVGDVAEAAVNNNYEMIIIADHGNSDNAINPNNTPNTAHSLNPVPFILISDRFKAVKNGKLADVAPSILDLMGIEQAKEMTGQSLIIH